MRVAAMMKLLTASSENDDEDICYLCSDDTSLTILASILWLVLLGWVFCALAIVAEDYLEPSLRQLAKYFDLPANVATAVFLAFGSAVPEIMTSIVSTISGKVDASLPAILGSGCIAYAVIPPICVLGIQPFFMSRDDRLNPSADDTDIARFYRKPEVRQQRRQSMARERRDSLHDTVTRTLSGAPASPPRGESVAAFKHAVLRDVEGMQLELRLATLPLVRDVCTYVLALGLTIVFIEDTKMEWMESTILLLVYVGYIVVLVGFKHLWDDDDENIDDVEASQPLMGGATKEVEYSKSTISVGHIGAAASKQDELSKDDVDDLLKGDTMKGDTMKDDTAKNETTKDDGTEEVGEEDAEEVAGEEEAEAEVSVAADAELGVDVHEESEQGAPEDAAQQEAGSQVTLEEGVEGSGEGLTSEGGAGSGSGNGTPGAMALPASKEGEEEEDENLMCLVANYPFYTIFQYTIPDCQQEGWENWFAVTFVVSLAYIAGLAMVTLFLVTQLCLTMGLPQSLSGLTLIALGAEIPDTVASLALAKTGQGPSAVSNCLNSQIINLLVGLGLPYLLHSIMSDGSPMKLGESGSTQVFIGALLALLVSVFLWFTVGEQVLSGRGHTHLTVGGAVVLLLLYLCMVIAVTVWSYEVE